MVQVMFLYVINCGPKNICWSFKILCFFSQSDVIGILFFIFLGEELMSHIEDFDNTLRF